MKKYSILKVALASLFLATVVIIGCSKGGLNAGAGSLAGSEMLVSSNGQGDGNPHFKDCPDIKLNPPTRDNCSTSASFTGTLVGTGNSKGAYLCIIAKIKVTPVCYNPSGKEVEGVSKVFERKISNKYYPFNYELDRNGRIDFSELTPSITEADFGKICPSDKWDFCLKNPDLLEWHVYLDGKEVTSTVGNLTCNSPANDYNGTPPCTPPSL